MIIHPYGSLSEEEIFKFEQEIKFSLPEDYKQFLKKYNGGSAVGNIFHVESLGEEIPLQVLYGLELDKELNLRIWNTEFKDDLLDNSIIIGSDLGGGLIVLINSPQINGIYYWDDSFYFEGSDGSGNTYKIADSFQQFIDGLTESEA